MVVAASRSDCGFCRRLSHRLSDTIGAGLAIEYSWGLSYSLGMKLSRLFFLFVLAPLTMLAEPPAGTTLGEPTKAIVETAFDKDTPRTRKGDLLGWKAGIGEWRVENGMLIGDELEENHHASSLTHRFEATDLIITAQVRLGTAKSIAFACRDTVPPNLHLGRLFITPDMLWIQHMSGIAKTTKSTRLVTKKVKIDPEKWYDVTIEIIGDTYRAKVGDTVIEGSHPRFADAKGIVALVNKGQGANYRKVAIWHAKPKS